MKSFRMRTILLLVVLALLTTAGIWPTSAKEAQMRAVQNQLEGPVQFKAGEVIVKFKDGATIQSAAGLFAQSGVSRIRGLYGSEAELWQVPVGQELATIEQLGTHPTVEYAEPNYLYHLFDSVPNTVDKVPNDPYFDNQWGLAQINASPAWDVSNGSKDTVIAIIDSGVDPNHPDLASKLVAGYDFVDADSSPRDENGHGTHVAGIAAAVANNGVGVAGMDWQAKIMPVRVADREGSAFTSDIIEGINWAYQHGADIINLSLGGPTYSSPMQAAVQNAHQAGSLVVAAMGNDRQEGNSTKYPAAYAFVMAVAATGPVDKYAAYSQYGAHCDISAPGGDMSYVHDPDGIFSAMPTYSVYMNNVYAVSQNYDYLQGTSQAAPFVAGLAGLVLSTDPNQTPDQVQGLIESSADDLGAIGWDSTYGHGRINAEATLQGMASPSRPTLAPISNPDGDGDYTVAWSLASGAASYVLQEADNGGFNSPHTINAGTATQYGFANKPRGSTWYYRVMANNSYGESDWSNVESVTVAPPAPDLDAIVNPDQQDAYTISWSTADGAPSYHLVESTDPLCSSPFTRYQGFNQQYQVTGQEGGGWYYCVRATNGGGSGPWSSAISTTVTLPALDAPPLKPIDNGGNDPNYLVEWSAVPTNPITYTLEQANNAYFVDPKVIYSGTALLYPAEEQPIGTWHYRVRAFGADGKSPWGRGNTSSTNVKGAYFLPMALKGFPPPPPDENWKTITSEGFEGAFPGSSWEVFDNGFNPGDYSWGKRTCQPYEGANSGWAVGGGGDGQSLGCSDRYPNMAESWMVYGPFSLADASDATLVYQAWLNVEPGDKLCHMASTDGKNFAGSCTSSAIAQQEWLERELDLTDVYSLGDLTGQPAVWIVLIFESGLVDTKEHGAYVDDILLKKYVGSATVALTRDLVPHVDEAWEEPAFSIRKR